MARTPTKKAEVQCVGDFDKTNSDEGDCNAAGTDDEEERDDGDDADDCDVDSKSRCKGHKRFFFPKTNCFNNS